MMLWLIQYVAIADWLKTTYGLGAWANLDAMSGLLGSLALLSL